MKSIMDHDPEVEPYASGECLTCGEHVWAHGGDTVKVRFAKQPPGRGERDYLRGKVESLQRENDLLGAIADAAAAVEQELSERGDGRVARQALDELTSALVEWEQATRYFRYSRSRSVRKP